MTTSSSIDFSQTRDEIINSALRVIGVLPDEETASSAMTTNGSSALNMMIKAWGAKGVHLWSETDAVLFLTSGTQYYSLGTSGNRSSKTYVQTALSAAHSAGATTINVDSTTGMTVSDVVGIELTSGLFQWTTIATIPGSTSFTIGGGGLTGAASDDGVVFSYTSILERPLKIKNVRIRDETGNEIPVRVISRQEYFDLPYKASTGKINQVYYDPQLTNSRLYVWPASDNYTDVLRFTYSRTLEDMDTGANTFDFPQEWFEALKFNLAVRLAPEYGVPLSGIPDVITLAASSLSDILSWDREETSIYFSPDYC